MLMVGFVVTGCDTTTGGETDTWSDITSLEQINGLWKGSSGKTMNSEEMLEAVKKEMEKEGVTWTPEFEDTYRELYKDISTTLHIEMDVNINASAKKLTGSMEITETFSGGNIEAVWLIISGELSDGEGVTVNNSNHSIAITQPIDIAPVEMSDMDGVQINQNGTKLKVSLDSMGMEIPSFILSEIMFTKQ
jgi:hypothetical protein